MARILDNIEKELLQALQEILKIADRSDFCVGYFNLHSPFSSAKLQVRCRPNAPLSG
jgi:hypothetical protein